MNRRPVQTSAQYLVAIVVAIVSGTSLCSQTIPANAGVASTAVSIDVRDRMTVSQPPILLLTIDDISDHITTETSDMDYYRIHLVGDKGEPQKTLWYRRILREPGVEPLETTVGPVTRYIAPGGSVERTFLLSALYDLSVPDRYKVYLDVRDYETGIWLRTNTVTFEVRSRTQ